MTKMEQKQILQLIRQSPYGFACGRLMRDASGKICGSVFLEVNTILEKTSEWKSALIGKSLGDFIGKFQSDAVSLSTLYEMLVNSGYAEVKELQTAESGKWFHLDIWISEPDLFALTMRDITDERLASQQLTRRKNELESAQADFDVIFNSTQDAMFMAEYTEGAFRYIRINSAHEGLTGFKNKEIKGKTPVEVWGKETGEALNKLYYKGLSSGVSAPYEEIRKIEGTEQAFLTSFTPVINHGHKYLVCSRKDITEYKKLQINHNALIQRLESMFNSHIAIMMVIDPETGKILDINPAACSFYGYEKSELLGMNIQDINMLPASETAKYRMQAFQREQQHFVFPHR